MYKRQALYSSRSLAGSLKSFLNTVSLYFISGAVPGLNVWFFVVIGILPVRVFLWLIRYVIKCNTHIYYMLYKI